MKNDAMLKLKIKKLMIRLYADTLIRKKIITAVALLLITLSPYHLITCLYASQLKNITVKSEANSDSISVVVSSKTKFNIFRVDKPNRLVIDLTDCETAKKDFPQKTQFISNIRTGQYQEKKARIVIDLHKAVRYSAKSSDTEILVELTEKKLVAKPIAKKPKPEPVVKSTTTASAPEQIQTPVKPPIKVEPKVEPSTKTAAAPPQPAAASVKKQKVKTGPQPNIPDKKHLATVKEIKEKQPAVKKSTKEAQKPETKQETAKSGTLPKDLVTLDFTDADIKDVLQILAVKTGMNIIYSDDVTGTLSLHLENVPFDEAMNLILQMKGLVLQQVASNVLRVMTPANLTKERSDAVQVTQIFRLSYSKASDMSGKLTSIMTAESQKVTVQTDERTNSIIVTSTPEGLLAAATLINKLDVRPEQVLIEAKIVEIGIDESVNIGIDWSLSRNVVSESGAEVSQDAQSLTPSQSTIGSFTFGYLKSDIALTARLAAAQTKGNTKVLSQPRIATLNNMEATIMVGDQIPYAQTTVTTAGSTQSTAFINVGIQLTVKPTINADGRITMEIAPTVSYPRNPGSITGGISTRTAKTTVLVRNGETIVIGGLITDQEGKDVSQIPLLGDLPVLGSFFKSLRNTKSKTELLIFMTPYIMKE